MRSELPRPKATRLSYRAAPAQSLPSRSGSGGDILVVDEGVHEQPLLDETLPLLPLALQVPVRVIGDHDAVRLKGQLHDEAVVIADHPLATHPPRRREHQDLLLLQVPQDVLVWEAAGHTQIRAQPGLAASPHGSLTPGSQALNSRVTGTGRGSVEAKDPRTLLDLAPYLLPRYQEPPRTGWPEKAGLPPSPPWTPGLVAPSLSWGDLAMILA